LYQVFAFLSQLVHLLLWYKIILPFVTKFQRPEVWPIQKIIAKWSCCITDVGMSDRRRQNNTSLFKTRSRNVHVKKRQRSWNLFVLVACFLCFPVND
jgi:hypothetical protein